PGAVCTRWTSSERKGLRSRCSARHRTICGLSVPTSWTGPGGCSSSTPPLGQPSGLCDGSPATSSPMPGRPGVRVFVPGTFPILRRWHAARLVDAPTAFAVTPALREWYANGDSEELEYAALTHAARASLRLLAEDPDAPPRRVVVAAD